MLTSIPIAEVEVQKNIPICVYYTRDGPIAWLAEKNDWVGKWVGSGFTKKISLFMSDEKLKMNIWQGDVWQLDVDWESKDEVLAWSLYDKSYLECRPGPEFLKECKKMPNYGANFFQNLRD